MKRIAMLFVLACFAVSSYAAERNLYGMFDDSSPIKVYLRDVTSDVKNPHVKIDTFKKIFADVLPKRLNIKFMPVNSRREADVIVTAKIKGYTFKEKTIPTLYSIPAIIADTTAPKSAAKLVVEYKVINPANDKLLLEYKNFTTMARHPEKDMVGDQAFIHAANKNVNRFIYRAFHKQRK